MIFFSQEKVLLYPAVQSSPCCKYNATCSYMLISVKQITFFADSSPISDHIPAGTCSIVFTSFNGDVSPEKSVAVLSYSHFPVDSTLLCGATC